MAFKNRGFLFAMLLVAAAAAELVGNASAATYVVGDSLGWRVPNTPADYANWASQHTFAVGDVLVFNFVTGAHDVARVTKDSYDGCSSSNPLSLATVGPSNITLSAAGETFYLCTFGSHCSLGQKLAINVSASSISPAPAPAPSTPTTPTTPTPTPTPSRSPSPSPSSPTPSPSPSSPTPTPTPMPSPGSAPAPTPSGSASPPPPGVPGLAPGSPTPPGDLSPPSPPPPPPSSATISTTSASLVGFAFVAVCLVI